MTHVIFAVLEAFQNKLQGVLFRHKEKQVKGEHYAWLDTL